jgi:hypothetical protein
MSAHFVRLNLEVLEDRTVLDAMTFQPLLDNGNYSDVTAWFDNTLGQPAKNAPGPGASATIPSDKICDVDAAESVGDITVNGTLNVNHNLSLAANSKLGLTGTVNVSLNATMTVADNVTLSANNLSIAGTVKDNSVIDITSNGTSGSGTPSFGSFGSMVVGSSDNPNSEGKLDTVNLSMMGNSTLTIGGPSGGSSGTVDTTNAGSIGGKVNIGDPGTGMAGDMSVSQGMTVVPGGSLNVGGSAGSGGTLDVYSLTSITSAPITVNSSGKIDVKHDASLGGPVTVTGVINADNIDAFTGASVTFTGTGTVSSGPLTGNLNAEANASFTFSPTSAVTLGAGATLGDGKFYVDGPLTVDTNLLANKPEFVLQGADGTNSGAIGDTGSIDWWNNEFDWQGGTIGLSGGLTIDNNADFKLTGAAPKTLSTTLTNSGGGTGTMSGDLENYGSVDRQDGSSIGFADGSTVDNAKGAVFDFENSLGGTITTFNNDGTLELGAGDTLTAGTFTQSSTGTLQSNIASATSYGSLSVTGSATLDGTLQGQLENGYQPPSGTSFQVLTFGSSSGQFATVSPSGWTAQYDPTDVMLVSG